jgi:FXSXX-COOH protein
VDARSRAAVPGNGAWAPLIDVTGISIADLHKSGDPILTRSVDRLVESLDDPNGIISAFNSFASS